MSAKAISREPTQRRIVQQKCNHALTLTFYLKPVYDGLECPPENKANGSNFSRARWIF
jgi:hypothetical protein